MCGDRNRVGMECVGTGAFARPAKRSEAAYHPTHCGDSPPSTPLRASSRLSAEHSEER